MVERSIQELHQDGVGEKASTGGQDESVGIDMKNWTDGKHLYVICWLQEFLDGASVEIFLEIYGLMEILSNLIWEFFLGGGCLEIEVMEYEYFPRKQWSKADGAVWLGNIYTGMGRIGFIMGNRA